MRSHGAGFAGGPLRCHRSANLATKAIDRYEIELTNHFAIEEQVLFPLIERELGEMPILAELIADHRALERMIGEMRAAPSAELLARLLRSVTAPHSSRRERAVSGLRSSGSRPGLLAAAGKQIDAQGSSRLPVSALCESR